MLKRSLLLFFALVLLLRADELTRAIQEELKNQGFYFSTPSGEMDEPTIAALKRFQIRNGLEPSGHADEATLKALQLSPTPQPTPPPITPPKLSQKDQEFLKSPMLEGEPDFYAFLFSRTPFESASRETQEQTLTKVQNRLDENGFYTGEINGQPSEELQLSIVRFQKSLGLPRTGKLDMETLKALGLLQDSEPQVGKRVYRGIWVR